jgi:hypothetical protein
MTDKVKLPKQLAEAIQKLQKQAYTKAGIIACMVDNDNGENEYSYKGCPKEVEILHRYYMSDPLDGELILKALANGYEVEQTSLEELKDFYLCQNEGQKYCIEEIMRILSEDYPEFRGVLEGE